mgnify:CR=1 FL=1
MICPQCNSEFTPRRRDQKTCSTKCSRAVARQKYNKANPAKVRETRLKSDRKTNGVDPQNYRTDDAASIMAKYGFELK